MPTHGFRPTSIPALVASVAAAFAFAATASARAQGGPPPAYAPPEPPPAVAPPPPPGPPPAPVSYGTRHDHHGLFSDSSYRSPGLAVALSLTPLPVDFGNFYAENLGWGVAYTAIEVSLLAPMMWVTGSHMGHGGVDDRRWSDGERGAMIGLLAGYVAVKLIAGLHAGAAARGFNRTYAHGAPFALPTRGGAVAGWSFGL